ncbi:hypothetical protein E2562_033977 [Oryza meyeriana var. granulata]|uniref:DUF834 domain-containing protein n=1 Tax=Oryza meyeriana var. granulata TaxID=110450 RepID=A0A6G1C265_9ORYZ|nr:hypothetical protein E2562_033977 [Oryza meyeriana var. granulata]
MEQLGHPAIEEATTTTVARWQGEAALGDAAMGRGATSVTWLEQQGCAARVAELGGHGAEARRRQRSEDDDDGAMVRQHGGT